MLTLKLRKNKASEQRLITVSTTPCLIRMPIQNKPNQEEYSYVDSGCKEEDGYRKMKRFLTHQLLQDNQVSRRALLYPVKTPAVCHMPALEAFQLEVESNHYPQLKDRNAFMNWKKRNNTSTGSKKGKGPGTDCCYRW